MIHTEKIFPWIEKNFLTSTAIFFACMCALAGLIVDFVTGGPL